MPVASHPPRMDGRYASPKLFDFLKPYRRPRVSREPILAAADTLLRLAEAPRMTQSNAFGSCPAFESHRSGSIQAATVKDKANFKRANDARDATKPGSLRLG